MLKGKKINSKNFTMGVISMSAPEALLSTNEYENGLQELKERGIKIVESPSVRKNYLYLSNRPQKLAEELVEMFENPEVDVVICAGGGRCSNKVLPYLDFERIKKNYKPFIGISDITTLLLGLASNNIVSFHGPSIIHNYGYDELPTDYTHNNLIEMLRGNLGSLKTHTNSKWKTYQHGSAEGKLIGGNISTIAMVVGTKYCPVELFDNSILFVEDLLEDYPSLDSKLTLLKLHGIFEKIKGVVFGKLPGCEPLEGIHTSLEEFLSFVFEGYNFPIIYDCDFGHIPDNLTLPLGCKVRLIADDNSTIILEESGVESPGFRSVRR